MQVHEAVKLEQDERDHLVRIIEASLRVNERHQFFLWTQGALQALLPHEILICGLDMGGNDEICLQRFSSSPEFHDEHFDAVCHPNGGLVTRLMRYWRKTGRPCLLAPEYMTAGCGPELIPLLEHYQLINVAAHGISAPGGRIKGYFSFSRVRGDFGPRLVHILELLAPYLHLTYARVLAQELGIARDAQPLACPVTLREAEILEWVREGKTNADIAAILQLSPLTVKNHVQKIFKKLGVNSRSQAVARGISLGIIKSSC